MQWYTPVPPRPDLTEVLACAWTAAPTGEHRLVPDGCIDLLWTSQGHLVLCGPETTAWTFALPEGTTAAGVRFLPGVAPALFGFDASKILNRQVNPVGRMAGSYWLTLVDELMGRHDSAAQREVLESFVNTRVGESDVDSGIADLVVDRVVAHQSVTTADLADVLGLSTRQLHRRAVVSFGYGVKTLARLIRFQRFLALVEGVADQPLAHRAAEAGYSDHAHLTRDCRAITGLTPTEFLVVAFPTFPDMSDPFKTSTPLTAIIER